MCFDSSDKASQKQYCVDQTQNSDLNNDPIPMVQSNSFYCVNTPNATNIVCSSDVKRFCYDAKDVAGQTQFCSYYAKNMLLTQNEPYSSTPTVTGELFYCNNPLAAAAAAVADDAS